MVTAQLLSDLKTRLERRYGHPFMPRADCRVSYDLSKHPLVAELLQVADELFQEAARHRTEESLKLNRLSTWTAMGKQGERRSRDGLPLYHPDAPVQPARPLLDVAKDFSQLRRHKPNLGNPSHGKWTTLNVLSVLLDELDSAIQEEENKALTGYVERS